jgi:hypothetical protein
MAPIGMVNFYFNAIYSREWPGSSSHSPLAGTPKVLTWLPTMSIHDLQQLVGQHCLPLGFYSKNCPNMR